MKKRLILFLFFCSSLFGQSVPLPNRALTPGVADPTLTAAVLCARGYRTGTNRHVTRSEKLRVCRAYGIDAGCPGRGYELDHLISLELGGSNDPANLWPQPADAPGVIGYHTKDVVENRAHAAVCRGRLSLAAAQRGIATDWYTFGLRYRFIR